MSDIKTEAVKRMKMMDLYTPVIYDFREEGRVQLSEPPMGACYFLNEEQQAVVDKFEAAYPGYLVYHVVRTWTEFGELLALLYVSTEQQEWAQDRHDITKMDDGMMFPFAWVENLNCPECSEFGQIGVKLSIAAGLMRYY